MISEEELRECLLRVKIPVEKVNKYLSKSMSQVYERGKAEEIDKILVLLKERDLLDTLLENSSYVLARR